MATTSMSLFEPNANAAAAASRVLELINASPRTPTHTDIANAIEAAHDRGQEMTNSLSPDLQTFRKLQALERATHTDEETNALSAELNRLGAIIAGRPIATFSDLVERAMVAAELDLVPNRSGGVWELDEDAAPGRKATAQVLLGVMALGGATAVRLSDIDAGGSPQAVIGEPQGARPHKRLMQLAPGFFWSLRETSKEARGVSLDMAEFGPDYPYPLGREIILAQKGDGDLALYEAHRHASLTWLQRVSPVITDDGRTTDLTFEFADDHATPIDHDWRLYGVMRGHVVRFYLGGDDE